MRTQITASATLEDKAGTLGTAMMIKPMTATMTVPKRPKKMKITRTPKNTCILRRPALELPSSEHQAQIRKSNISADMLGRVLFHVE